MAFMKRNQRPKLEWLSTSIKPELFSLVWLKLSDGTETKGWWDGAEWYSRRKGDREVIQWKKREGEY